MRGNVAYVDDRASSLVDTSYEWRSRGIAGCSVGSWVGLILRACIDLADKIGPI
jgi:hypothetical protein